MTRRSGTSAAFSTTTAPTVGDSVATGIDAAAATPRAPEVNGTVADALRLMGGTTTAARKAIVASLVGAGGLQTPEVLLGRARARVRGVSLATVYRTLERLEAAHALKRVTLPSGEVGYAYCPPGHHEHAICVRCGRLQALRPCLVTETPPVEGFAVTTHVLDFYGVCAACAERDAEAAVAAETTGAGQQG